VGETLSYAASGDVRVLAVTAPERLTALPDTPTLMEQSADLVFANWRGVFAAPGTPKETVDDFQTDITAAVATERWAEAVARYGWSPLNLAGEDFARYLDAQAEQLREILISLGFIR
jgi:putative tricarboxylic transport membrane protein